MTSEILFTIHQSPWFFSFQGKLKILGIGSAERSWGDVKTIKSGKISSLGSDISDKQSIVYKSDCIAEAIIGRNISNIDGKYGSHSQFCNDEDHAFDYKLYQWGV